MKLIVGLGNPGKTYQKTRHNVGFVLLDTLADKLTEKEKTKWSISKKFNAETTELNIKNEKIILAKPMTYMNKSGESVQILMHYYKLDPKELFVIHDDKDIELGEIKIQAGKNAGGHNGVQSIIDHIGTNGFTRIRIGIAPKDKRKIDDTSKFVLKKFGVREKKKINESISIAINDLLQYIEGKSLLHRLK